MKTIKLLSLLGLAALAAAPWVRAEDPAATSAVPPAPAGNHPRPPRGDRLKMLAEKLNLTDLQKTQVKPILEKAMQDGMAIRDDDTLSEADKRTKGAAVRKTMHDSIRALLTPDQQKTYDAMPERGPRRGPPPGSGDTPPPPKPQ